MEILKLKNGFEFEIEESNSIYDLSVKFNSLEEAEKIKEELSKQTNLERVIFIKDKKETAYEYLQLQNLDVLIGEKRMIKFALNYRDKNEIEKAQIKTEQAIQNEAISELANMVAELIGGGNNG